MKVRLLISLLSIIVAFTFMSGGYGAWERTLIIRGNITVVEPPPKKANLEQMGSVTKSNVIGGLTVSSPDQPTEAPEVAANPTEEGPAEEQSNFSQEQQGGDENKSTSGTPTSETTVSSSADSGTSNGGSSDNSGSSTAQ